MILFVVETEVAQIPSTASQEVDMAVAAMAVVVDMVATVMAVDMAEVDMVCLLHNNNSVLLLHRGLVRVEDDLLNRNTHLPHHLEKHQQRHPLHLMIVTVTEVGAGAEAEAGAGITIIMIQALVLVGVTVGAEVQERVLLQKLEHQILQRENAVIVAITIITIIIIVIVAVVAVTVAAALQNVMVDRLLPPLLLLPRLPQQLHRR